MSSKGSRSSGFREEAEMLSKEEIKQWLLDNCVNEMGNLDLSGLDFSDFGGNVFIEEMKVKKNLIQSSQEVGGFLLQNNQKVGDFLDQDHQEVAGNLSQNHQKVGRDLYQGHQKVEGDLLQNDQEAWGSIFQD